VADGAAAIRFFEGPEGMTLELFAVCRVKLRPAVITRIVHYLDVIGETT